MEASSKVVDQTAAAKYIGRSPRTLEGWRSRGGGPIFCKVGSRVVYLIADLDEFIAKGRRTSTSDAGLLVK